MVLDIFEADRRDATWILRSSTGRETIERLASLLGSYSVCSSGALATTDVMLCCAEATADPCYAKNSIRCTLY